MILETVKERNKEGATGFRRSMTSGFDNDFEKPVVHLEVRNKELDFCLS